MKADHEHCPFGHDHPMPIPIDAFYDPMLSALRGRSICSHCWFRHEDMTLLVPCSPEVGCQATALESTTACGASVNGDGR